MNPNRETREPNSALLDRRIALGLRELDKLEASPDVADAVAERLASGEPQRQRASNWPMLAVAMLAIAATAAVFVLHEPTAEVVPATNWSSPPQDTVVMTVTSRAEIEQLPKTTRHVRGTALPAEAVAELRGLRSLERLDLDACPIINAAYLAAVGELNGLTALRLHGPFVAPADAAKPLGLLPRLAELVLIDTAHEPGPHGTDLNQQGTEPGLRDEHLIAARLTTVARLTATSRWIDGTYVPTLARTRVRALSLAGCRSLDARHLARLPKLVELDLTDTGIRDAATRFRALTGCLVTSSNGLRLRMAANPKQEPERLPWTVQLNCRTGSAYGDSAYSFARRTTDRALHNNYVDLVWSSCGQVHFLQYGGQQNRIRDLGSTALASVTTAPASWDELTSSFTPRQGHSYVFEVFERAAGQPFLVAFRIVGLDEQTLTLEWHHLDEAQDPGELPERGAAGASGACGGPHEPR